MISYDIFDTLITRKTALPTGIFLCMQQSVNIEDFVYHRISAEKEARFYAQNQGREEITLQEIYDVLSQRVGMDLSKLTALEQQIELENVYPIKENIEQLKEYVKNGERVVLISDMYLSETVIRKMLVQVDSVFQTVPMYVSCEYGKTKRTGALYKKVAEIEKDTSGWTHYGDNEQSDVSIAAMLGIQAKLVKRKKANIWEQEISEKFSLEKNLAFQYYAGASEMVHMEHELSVPEQIGVTIGGMVLYPYVCWVLQQCELMGIKHLYFLARDGYVLKKIADSIIQSQCLEIKTSYIYSSRKAWRLKKQEVEKRELLIQYLEQEIDFSEQEIAFVDFHGTGLTIEYLADILKNRHDISLKVFFYDLLENRKIENYDLIPFCWNHMGKTELLCRAPHGATLGYKIENGEVQPCLQSISSYVWEQAGYTEYVNGVELFAKMISVFSIDINKLVSREISETVMEYLDVTTERKLLEFLGNIPHKDGVEQVNDLYAPALTAKDVFKIYMWRTLEPVSDFYSGVDFSMSLRRTEPKYLKQKQFWECHYCKLLGKIVHRIKMRGIPRPIHKKKIVIYAAGKCGQIVYEHLRAHPGYKVTAWTDKNAPDLRKQGLPVVDIENALQKSYDYIVIAIKNPLQSNEVKYSLRNRGIADDKIWQYEDLEKSL